MSINGDHEASECEWNTCGREAQRGRENKLGISRYSGIGTMTGWDPDTLSAPLVSVGHDRCLTGI